MEFARSKHNKIKDELAKFLRKKFGDHTVFTEKSHSLPNNTWKFMDIYVDLGSNALIIEVKSPWDADRKFNDAYTRACDDCLDVELRLLERHYKNEVKIFHFVIGSLGRWHKDNDSLLHAIGWNDDEVKTYATRVAKRNIEMCAKHFSRHLLYISNEEIIRDGTA